MISYLDDQSSISNCYHVLRFIVPSEGNNQWSLYDFFDHQELCNKQDKNTASDWKIFT